MPAFLGKKYYCHTCKKGYTHRDKHKCPNKCFACFKTEQHTGDKITCDNCNRTFFWAKILRQTFTRPYQRKKA